MTGLVFYNFYQLHKIFSNTEWSSIEIVCILLIYLQSGSLMSIVFNEYPPFNEYHYHFPFTF